MLNLLAYFTVSVLLLQFLLYKEEYWVPTKSQCCTSALKNADVRPLKIKAKVNQFLKKNNKKTVFSMMRTIIVQLFLGVIIY